MLGLNKAEVDAAWEFRIAADCERTCQMSPNNQQRTIRLLAGAASGSVAVLAVSYFAFRARANLPTAGFLNLLIVVLAALRTKVRMFCGDPLLGVKKKLQVV